MNQKLKERLRREVSMNYSGEVRFFNKIPLLREKDYWIMQGIDLDGDAPKQFIKVYEYGIPGLRRSTLNSWVPYIVKTAEKWYPHESMQEYLINRIGQVLGLKMNEINMYRINGQVRFLSKFFLRTEQESLIHGTEICGEYLADNEFAHEIAVDRQEARQLYTFEFIEEAIKGVFTTQSTAILSDLVRILVFDALVGNNDRHFYNWAVIRPIRKGRSMAAMSPVYDSSRGLLWNISDQKCVKWSEMLAENPNFRQFDHYVVNAAPRISIETDKSVNHFQLMEYLCSCNKEYATIVKSLSSEANQQKVVDLYQSDFAVFYIKERNQLVTKLIKERFERVRESF